MLNPWPHTLCLAVALATMASPALAQDLSFNLPAGNLASTLNTIASQSGQIVSLEPALVQGKQAPAVIGHMSPEQAMEAALQAHGHWQGEFWNRRGDGSLYAVASTINTVCDDAGAAYRLRWAATESAVDRLARQFYRHWHGFRFSYDGRAIADGSVD